MIKVIVSGATGAMGNVLINLINESDDFKLVAGFAKEDENREGYTIYSDYKKIKEDADVLIDFSSKYSIDSVLSLALEKNIPLVLASTGFDEIDLAKIKKASENIPIVQSGNFSLGVNVMVYISKLLSKLLDGFEIEIIEAHHHNKKDAPSGTANMLFDAVNEARDGKLSKVYGREGFTDNRNPNEVGMHSLRAGSINGDHEVIFAGLDEVVTISHHAASKKIFALGSLKAAKYIMKKENGLIDINEILNIGE